MPNFEIKTIEKSHSNEKKPLLTILVPARNESVNIAACIASILAVDVDPSSIEIIVLDDFSQDDTAAIALSCSPIVRVVAMADVLPASRAHLPNKKFAITTGVNLAQADIIICTDADCRVPPNWLGAISTAFVQMPGLQALTGPVVFAEQGGLLSRFQTLDLAGMMGITAAGHFSRRFFMANGANLAFRKTAFEAVGGYAGNAHIASGDDMFLMQKIAMRFPDGLSFLKCREAVVSTAPAPDWSAFWHQRLRWGGKNATLPNWPLRLSLLVVFLFCWALITLWVTCLFTLNVCGAAVLVWALGVKAFFDYRLLAALCNWLGIKHLQRWFWPSFVLHVFYVAVVGAASIFSPKNRW